MIDDGCDNISDDDLERMMRPSGMTEPEEIWCAEMEAALTDEQRRMISLVDACDTEIVDMSLTTTSRIHVIDGVPF